jgi:hypothetical protein
MNGTIRETERDTEMDVMQHVPEIVYFDEWHVTIPAEVCRGCSDPDAGRWVPASFCPAAAAVMKGHGNGCPR